MSGTSFAHSIAEQASKLTFKVVLLGDTGVGKTCIANRFINNDYNDNSVSTVGTCYYEQELVIDSRLVHITLWDTAGQERYASLTRCYYRGAQAALVIFDVSQEGSFEKAKKWINELQESVGEGIVIALVGNKADLEKREVPLFEVKEYVKRTGIMYMEASAKKNEGIHELFLTITQQLIRNEIESCVTKNGEATAEDKGKEKPVRMLV